MKIYVSNDGSFIKELELNHGESVTKKIGLVGEGKMR